MLACLPNKEADTTITRPDESLTRRIEVGLTTHSESAGCTTFEEAKVPDEMLELAIDFTIRQVSKYFHDGLYRKIGISGSGVEKVAKALKDTWEIKAKCMPLLRVLDLSYTSIKSLPPSISRLRSLQTFNLRGCALLMELPPQLGVLGNLEVFDLEGTEIMYLPEEIGELISLTCFKVSFCGRANRYMDLIIPTKALSKLSELEELSIDGNPDDEWWDAEVKTVLNELSKALKLKFLELYLPTVEILQLLRWKGTELQYPNWFEFRFIVGRHRQRLISRLPHEVEERFKKWNKWRKCLEYINGDGKPTEITEVLNRAFVFFLYHHWTIKMLSDFRNENLVKLKFCLLVECNELQTIIDGNYKYP
ncbi:putative disease resistance protein [Camellia lanceoleosa]|uniref:Disease resistance protein n=1 Tax=Camellia lanceoleosa TaxID=1840588 RepID=A0ACC0IIT4_9ERIC|nr:putative disease resistance protein [Camellia lanceoleosa]